MRGHPICSQYKNTHTLECNAILSLVALCIANRLYYFVVELSKQRAFQAKAFVAMLCGADYQRNSMVCFEHNGKTKPNQIENRRMNEKVNKHLNGAVPKRLKRLQHACHDI